MNEQSLDAFCQERLSELEERNLRRSLRRVSAREGVRACLEGRSALVLGSNSYLGLERDPRVRAAAKAALAEWGTGSTGSRLTTGCLQIHAALESEVADWLGTEAAVLFGSGYLANVGVIPALTGRGDLVLSDELNHASLIDGCRLSRAERRVYRHGDADHARELLADREKFRRCMIVTDGVFSMDGDLAPLGELCALAQERDAWMMVDDAHGVGVLGATGGGSVELLGVEDRVAVRMGTLSKALGAEGAIVAGSRALADLLRNRARSFIYSTAPSPASVAAAREAVAIVREEPERLATLRERADFWREGLRRLGFAVVDGVTPIVPIILGDAELTVRFAECLEAEGVWVTPIRPPTVPEGASRLRATVSAAHSEDDLRFALRAFEQVGGDLGVLRS